MSKRFLDILIATTLLILLAPIMLLIAVLIKKKLGSPIFFQQIRPGKNMVPFKMFKFRTMTQHCDALGRELPDCQRMIPFGILLRSTSLDELPELWNVLKGDMSLVGPRPLLLEYLPLYSEIQNRRHDVKPGITGLAQINGRNSLSWKKKFQYDVWYVRNRSFCLDMKVLLFTISKVMFREGVSETSNHLNSKFKGKDS